MIYLQTLPKNDELIGNDVVFLKTSRGHSGGDNGYLIAGTWQHHGQKFEIETDWVKMNEHLI